MSIHIAILTRPYLNLVLSGAKTVESRLTRTGKPPFNAIAPGERIFLKQSAGPFRATAVAGWVKCFDGLTPADMARLRRTYQPTVGGDDAYWHHKRDSRFATFVELTQVEPMDVGPPYKVVNMKAWYVLEDRLSPLRETTLTHGAIRNGYAAFPMPEAHTLRLQLPDGRCVETDVARGRMLRWRGWRAYYRRYGVQPGDRVRFVAVGRQAYRVSFHHGGAKP